MANSINYAAVFNRILDEKFYILPRTMWMEDTNPGIVWEGGKEVKIPKLGMDGLGTMNGYKAPQGDLTLAWETKTLQWYRGRNFSIGRYDVDETNFALTVGNALRVFLNEKVIPEVDCLRIAAAAQGAVAYGQVVAQASADITTANILGLLLADIAKVQDKIGETEQLYIQISTGLKSLLEQSQQITRYLNVKDFAVRSATLRLEALNDQFLIGTPSGYMHSVFGLNDGTTGGLYLEIDCDYLLEPVQVYGQDYENICLIGNQGNVLYANDDKSQIQELLRQYPEKNSTGTHKVAGGYLLIREMEETNWKLCTLVTESYLWSRTSFILIFFILTFAVTIVVMLIVVSRIVKKVIHPVIVLSEEMGQNDYERLNELEVVQTGDEIQTLYECYNEMIAVVHQGIEARIAYEKNQKQMEFAILLSQIHPHYLYNVLNTVVYLAAAGKNKEVVKIAQALIYSLQETLRLGEKNIETDIRNELRLLESYLDIQRYRYPDLFEVEIDCKEEYMDYTVPKTILQPLVENAIVHGVLPTEEKGNIYIRMEKMASCFRITVEDDGIGIPEEALQLFESGKPMVDDQNGRMHIGISNIRDRILYLYGEPYGMRIERGAETGTKIILELPLP